MVQTETRYGPLGQCMSSPSRSLDDEGFIGGCSLVHPGMVDPPMMGGQRCRSMGEFGRRSRHWMKNLMAVKPVLTYFDVPGLAEQVRMCFIAGGVPFVDRRITEEEFTKHYKAYSPTGRVPFLEVNGEILVESQAVTQYAARRAGLLPSTTEGQLKADMLIEMMEDDLQEMKAKMPATLAREDQRKWYLEAMKNTLPDWLEKYEARMKCWVDLEKDETWIIDDRMSYGDICLVASIYRTQSMTGVRMCPDTEKYPVLSKIYLAVMELPTVSAYVKENEKKAKKPVLYHFGYGESRTIEWALKIGHIEYDEKLVAKEECEGFKQSSPNGKMPMLEVGCEKYAGSVAILQYVAKRADLIPLDDFSAAHALAVVKVCSELWSIGERLKDKEGDEKKQAVEKAVGAIPEVLARIEEVVGQRQDGEGHVVCKKLSYADLWVAQTVELIRKAGPYHGVKIPNLHALAPKMSKTYRLVMAVPEVSQHERESMAKVKPVLTYFDLSGRAEACRYAMLIAGIDFEDRRITREDWLEVYKVMSPTGQCPFLTVGRGRTIPEAKAILQWVCEVKPELKPTHPMERVIAEQLVSSWSRVHVAMRKLYEVPIEERDAFKPKLRDEFVLPAMEVQEKLWKDCNIHEGYSVGDKITWVDCWVAGEIEYVAGWAGVMGDDWQEKFPTLARVFRRVTAHKAVADYRAAHN